MTKFIFPRNTQRQRKVQSQGLGAQLSPNEAETLQRISAAAPGPNNYSLKDVKTLRHRMLIHDKNGELELTSAGETKQAADRKPDTSEPPGSFVQSFLICTRKVRAVCFRPKTLSRESVGKPMVAMTARQELCIERRYSSVLVGELTSELDVANEQKNATSSEASSSRAEHSATRSSLGNRLRCSRVCAIATLDAPFIPLMDAATEP